MLEGGGDDIGLDLEVDRDEIGGISVVGVDPANFGGGEDDIFRLVVREEGVNGGLGCQVKLGVGAKEEIGVAEGVELADDGGTNQAAVAGDEYGGGSVDWGWRHGGGERDVSVEE